MANNKLYPPYIEGVIPSFFGKETITVPYSANRAVSDSDKAGFFLKIKSVQNYLIGTLDSTTNTFKLTEEITNQLRTGEFYKVQLAYYREVGQQQKEEGYYSTVGVVKYTNKPEVVIEGLEEGTHSYNYIGVYKNEDASEKVYSYNFKIYDINNKVIADSGELLHNSTVDTSATESRDEFLYNRDIEPGATYFIQYTITTINRMVCASPLYRIQQQQTIAPDLKADFNAKVNFENGYVDLSLSTESNSLTTGAFRIMRAKAKDKLDWEEIYRFYILNKNPNMGVFRDFTVEQGETYIYSLQQYANNLYSDRILSNEVFVDFEDAFLFDGERQLKIKYNPKVSSFKTTILESKTDTLGSKYPFIFRNGNVEYKEFPISGLISYWMDDEDLFAEKDFEDKFRTSTISNKVDRTNLKIKTTNLTGENIHEERKFKLNVLDWLNNGQAKLFRSPGEGNYIVRLMNVSLAPNDTLGRMLHTFSATAYEVAEYNYENLNKNNMIKIEEPSTENYYWKTIIIENMGSDEKLIIEGVSSFNLEGAVPGDMITIDGETVVIGTTGSYKIDGDDLTITIDRKTLNQGHLTYQYKAAPAPQFALIKNIEIKDCALRQFVGEHKDILSIISDVRTEVLKYYRLSFKLRPVFDVNSEKDMVDEYMIYKYDGKYYDGYLWTVDRENAIINYDTTFKIDNDVFDIKDTRVLDVYDIEKLNTLAIGSGIIAELSYQYRTSNFHLEDANNKVVAAKENYNTSYENYKNNLDGFNTEEIHTEVKKVEESYLNYVKVLGEEINKYKADWGMN